MTATAERHDVQTSPDQRAPWPVVIRAAAALAVSTGVGRFVYTPILPLMHRDAGLTSSFGASLATLNYVGYLVGALAGIAAPWMVRSSVVFRAGLLTVVATLALMPLSTDHAIWAALRFIAGAASAMVFVIAVSAMLSQLKRQAQHLIGWGFGGVGAGIALSGAIVLAVRTSGGWRAAWLLSAVLALDLCAAAWRLAPESAEEPTSLQRHGSVLRTHRWFAALWTSYTLEGIGYIIAGTFLVRRSTRTHPSGSAAERGFWWV